MKTSDQPAERLRLADLLAALSLETDLAMGHAPEEAMRTYLLATGLARRIGLSETEVADVYWTALLMHVGCTAFAHEEAALFEGDEIAVNAAGSKTDPGNTKEMLTFLLEVSEGRGLLQRARLFFMALTRGERFGHEVAAATCEVAAFTAERVGLPDAVQRALDQLFERWDGKGDPQKLHGKVIALPARSGSACCLRYRVRPAGGEEAAVEMARCRSGTALDPHLADAFSHHAKDLLEEVHADDPWCAALEAEPAPQRWLPESGIDEVARAWRTRRGYGDLPSRGGAVNGGRIASLS